MKPAAAWTVVAVALAAGWFSYRWQGVVLALTVIVFWLLLQFSRALRVMRKAGAAPVGRVASAVMLHSRLREGMTLAQLLAVTGSLGERVALPPGGDADEAWRWRDDGEVSVTVELHGGRTRRWTLQRPDGAAG